MHRVNERTVLRLSAALCLCVWEGNAAAQPVGPTGPGGKAIVGSGTFRMISLDRAEQIPAAVLQGPTNLVFGKQLTAETALQQPVFRVLRLPTKQGEAASLSCMLHRLDAMKVQMLDGRAYDRLLPGELTVPPPVGSPEQFSGLQLIRIPDGATPTVAVDQITWKALPGAVDLPPYQMPEPDIALRGPGPVQPQPFVKDPVAFARRQLWPTSPVQLKGTVRIRGESFAVITYTPIAYNPSAKQGLVATDVNWRLTFGPIGNAPAPAPDEKNAPPAAVGRILDARPAPMQVAQAKFFPPLFLTMAPWQSDYLIITADKFVEEIQPLADWKRQKGYDVYVARLSAVGGSAAQIKQYISNAYQVGGGKLHYVLLVGDMDATGDAVPGVPLVGHSYHGATHEWATDHDYACVDGTDLFADVVVGRLSADTEAQVTAMVNNILRYERTPVPGDWYSTAMISAQYQSGGTAEDERWFCETSHRLADFLGGDYDFFGSWNGYGGTDPFNKGYTIHTAIEWGTAPSPATTLYYQGDGYPWRMTPPSPIPAAWKNEGSGAAAQISAVINAGAGFVFHRDHGWDDGSGWAHPDFSIPHVNALANGTRQPVVFSPDCCTGWIDGKDAFAEAWVRHNSGGAVGFLGANRASWSGMNDVFCIGLMDSFWDDYTTNDGGVGGLTAYPNSWRVAEAMVRAKAIILCTYGTDDKSAQTTCRMYNWLGDPEMMLRNCDPFSLNVAHEMLPWQLSEGQPTQVVRVTVLARLRSPVLLEDALVSIRTAGATLAAPGQAARATTNHQGVAFVALKPEPGQQYNLTVTAHNAIPYEAVVVLAPAAVTSAPQAATTCRQEKTVCPAVLTGCPTKPTLCPRCAEQQTVYPAVTTQCPTAQTTCPACPVVPLATLRPAETQCPTRTTFCPQCAVPMLTASPQATACPTVETACPQKATACPRLRTKCPVCETVLPPTARPVATECPVVTTRCPQCPFTPQVTTAPLSTQCPRQQTQCPACVVPLATVVPRQTSCPRAETVCPAQETTCPRCDLIPMMAVPPMLQTRCPLVETQHPVCPPG